MGTRRALHTSKEGWPRLSCSDAFMCFHRTGSFQSVVRYRHFCLQLSKSDGQPLAGTDAIARVWVEGCGDAAAPPRAPARRKAQHPGRRRMAAPGLPGGPAHGRPGDTGQNWFIVLCWPAAFSAASPLKYSLWSSPRSEPDMFWCLTQAMPWRISLRCTPAT